MGFFDRYPYTNWHNVNLDWVLERVKEWGQMVEANDQAFKDLEEANASFKEYVTNYLQNLDIQAQIDDKLDRMFESGELTDYLQPYVSNTVTDWLKEHITEPEGVVIDSSLTVAGAAADAKAVGDAIDALKKDTISRNVKQALLACFRHVGWDHNTDVTYYNALYLALYPDTLEDDYQFSFAKTSFAINGVSPSGTVPESVIRINNLPNRARTLTPVPITSGTITAKSGYKICVYMTSDITPVVDVDSNRNLIPGYSGLDSYLNYASYPEWVDSFNISDSNCKYVLLSLKKDSDENWTNYEMENVYGTVFTAQGNQPTLKDILSITNGKTIMPSVNDPSLTVYIDGVGYNRVVEIASAARAHTNILPFTTGIFESCDPTKYQISVYQLMDNGLIIPDADNPSDASIHMPSWAERYIIGNKKCACVQISFKKIDGTNFSQNEIENAYGTIFRYWEAIE